MEESCYFLLMRGKTTRKQYRIQLEPEIIERLDKVAAMISGSMTGQKLAADLIRDNLAARAQIIEQKMPEIRQHQVEATIAA